MVALKLTCKVVLLSTLHYAIRVRQSSQNHLIGWGARDWILLSVTINALKSKCIKFVSPFDARAGAGADFHHFCSLSTYQHEYNQTIMIYSNYR
jgi:hypothetical protein